MNNFLVFDDSLSALYFPPKHFAALLAQSEISQRAFHKVNLLKAIL